MGTSFDLSGRNTLITGAGVRIGRAIALGLARSGSNLAIHYRSSDEEAQETARAARDYGVETALVQADLANPLRAADVLQRAAAELGPIDYLVNNAAVFGDETLANMGWRSWERHMSINLASPVFLAQAFGQMIGARKGAILNMLDWRAFRPGPDHFPYSVSKAALAAATKALAQALAPAVRVNGLALGAILPPLGTDEGPPGLIDQIPLGRWGELEEVVDSALFLLAGPEYLTGAILSLDGGRHLV